MSNNKITLDKLNDNLEQEYKSVDFDTDIKVICDNYDESNLLFYETGNRMGGPGGIFVLYKNNNYKLIYVDEENDLLYEHFPIAMSLYSKYEDNYNNPKYEYIYTGFGGKLYIDKSIYNVFYEEAVNFFIENDFPYDGTFSEQLIHSYWLTIVKRIINYKKGVINNEIYN